MPQQELNLTGVPQETRVDLPADSAEVSIAELAANWLAIIRTKFRTTVELAAAEVKLAAMSFVLMNFLAVTLAILVLSGWGLVLAGIVVGLLSAGMSLWVVLLSVAAIHLILALVIWRAIARLSRHLNLTASPHESNGSDSRTGLNNAD